MGAEVELTDGGGNRLELPLELGEVTALEGSPGQGEARRIVLRNVGDTALRDVVIGLEGMGAPVVQLAVATEEGPGVWAAPGEEIIVSGTLMPLGDFAFFARPMYDPADVEGLYAFDFTIRAISVGE